jgi:hypothetical protein
VLSWSGISSLPGRFLVSRKCGMSPLFPQDIFEEIIRHPILQDDKKTLGSCSLVCSSWVWRSRRQLFRNILLANGTRVQSFAGLFASLNCTIGPHIQKVEVEMHDSSKMVTQLVSEAIQVIAKYVLACHHLSICPFNWTHFTVQTRNTFLCLGAGRIENLELFQVQCESLKELSVIISSFPKLLRLRLDRSPFHPFHRHFLPSTMSFPLSLTSLSLSGCDYTLLHPSNTRTVLPNLSSVKFKSLHPSSFANINAWLKQHAATLEHVELSAERLLVSLWNDGCESLRY